MYVTEDIGLNNLPTGGKLVLSVHVLHDNWELVNLIKASSILARITLVLEEKGREKESAFV